jgi:hypothetical protein
MAGFDMRAHPKPSIIVGRASPPATVTWAAGHRLACGSSASSVTSASIVAPQPDHTRRSLTTRAAG